MPSLSQAGSVPRSGNEAADSARGEGVDVEGIGRSGSVRWTQRVESGRERERERVTNTHSDAAWVQAPEYGATMGFFPVDVCTLDYLRLTGRDDKQVRSSYWACQHTHLYTSERMDKWNGLAAAGGAPPGWGSLAELVGTRLSGLTHTHLGTRASCW